ncbi:MAG TPA: hypothetical protein DDW52_01880, partial [Planctomycetaceae bacterium]|nr:hypothetical protein [Planctomycetaceae bacterium]
NELHGLPRPGCELAILTDSGIKTARNPFDYTTNSGRNTWIKQLRLIDSLGCWGAAMPASD